MYNIRDGTCNAFLFFRRFYYFRFFEAGTLTEFAVKRVVENKDQKRARMSFN